MICVTGVAGERCKLAGTEPGGHCTGITWCEEQTHICTQCFTIAGIGDVQALERDEQHVKALERAMRFGTPTGGSSGQRAVSQSRHQQGLSHSVRCGD
jgi:hypothetical protein